MATFDEDRLVGEAQVHLLLRLYLRPRRPSSAGDDALEVLRQEPLPNGVGIRGETQIRGHHRHPRGVGRARPRDDLGNTL